MSNLIIPYESENFSESTIPEPVGVLNVTWSDLFWAALTVGRASWADVWKHGSSSGYEAIFRCSLVATALEKRGMYKYLRATDAFKNMDPSEKAAINYFLGMVVCKLFAAKLLNTPWLLHLDVYRSRLRPELRSNSRPDLVGQQQGTHGSWRAFECKGRFRLLQATKDKAKAQAGVLVSVAPGPGRTACDLHVGAVTHFRREALHFYWRDPEPEPNGGDSNIALTLPQGAWRYYYAPVLNAIELAATGDAAEYEGVGRADLDRIEVLMASGEQPVLVNGLDIHVGVHRAVAEYLARDDWDGARRRAAEMADEFAEIPGIQSDGLIVKAGLSWDADHHDSFNSG